MLSYTYTRNFVASLASKVILNLTLLTGYFGQISRRLTMLLLVVEFYADSVATNLHK